MDIETETLIFEARILAESIAMGLALFAVRMGFIQWRQPGSVLA